MKPLACLIAVASGLWWSGTAVAQSRPVPPSSGPGAEIAQLRETLNKLTAATKELEAKLARLDQASRRSAPRVAQGGGMSGGGFGGTTGGPGGRGAFGGMARGPQGGSGSRHDDHATSHAGPPSFRSPSKPRGEGRGPSPRGGRSVDEKLDRIMRELEQLRRELRHSSR